MISAGAMRRLVEIIAAVAWVVPTLAAQSPNLNLTVASGSNGEVIATVQNLGPSALTACLYQAIFPAGPNGTDHGAAFAYKDAAIDGSTEPILPMQQREEHMPAGSQVTFLAAIWADGSTYGDAKRLLDHRSVFINHLDKVLAVLQQALTSGIGPRALVAQLEGLRDAITTEHPDDEGSAKAYYIITINRINNPPQDVDGTPLTFREILEREHPIDDPASREIYQE
jgi:hypothetical protein